MRSVSPSLVLAGMLFIILSSKVAAQDKPYDVQHYDLLIEPDFTTRKISLTATIMIDNPNLEKSFSFGLNDHYDSVSVTSTTSPVIIQRNRGAIIITVEKPAKQMSLVFNLKGSLGKSMDDDRDVVEDQSLYLLWSDRFYPIDFNDWATVRTTLVLPSHLQAIAPGKLTKIQNLRDKAKYVFETTNPAVNFSVLADSRWIITEREINGIRMQTLLYPESQKFAEQIFTTSSEILKFYAEIYCPYPFDQFSFSTIAGIYARRAFSGFVGYEPGYLEKEFTTTGHDAHETALLWWSYTTRGRGDGSFQWFEGFGDYAELLYDEKYHKPIPKIFQHFRDKYLASPPENDLLYTELRGSTDQAFIHGKYPWLMHLIRYTIGDKEFKRAMKLLFEKHKFRTLSMDEFVATLEEGSGKSLQWFRQEWLQRRGIPVISLKSEIQEKAGVYNIMCVLEQIGNLYQLPMEIGIETAKGMRVEKVHLHEKQMTFSFQSQEQPKRILLDPSGWILMQKMYD